MSYICRVKSFSITLFTFALLSWVLPNSAFAQNRGAVSEEEKPKTPWLYENSNIPVDKSWTFGVLQNGLRYAVKKNTVPKGQVSIRVRVDAGSLHERDNELGYAHLVEHLAFRGSTHVKDGEAKRIWQRIGVSFGSDSNAQTTATHTVYQLDIPNISAPVLGESVKILSGMIRNPRFSVQAVDAEKLIVQAEKREGDGAQRRVIEGIRAHFFQGQRLSKRPTIGTIATLQSATAQGLKAFHERWYRPEKTVIVMAGDSEPSELISLIETNFGDWKGKGVTVQQPDFGPPVKTDKVATVITEPGVSNGVTLLYARPWFQKNDTIVYNEQILIDSVALQIINRRLESEAQSSADYLFAQASQQDISRSSDATLISIVPAGDNWEQAMLAVRSIIEDSIQTAPSQEDIDREVSAFADQLKTLVDSYPFESSTKQVDSIVGAVDIRETVASPETIASVFHNMKPRFNRANILTSTKKLFDAPVKRAAYTGSKSSSGDVQKLAAALNKKVTANENARLAKKSIGLDALPKLGPAGSLASIFPIDQLDIEMLEFSNGVRAIIQSNKAEAGQIRILVRFGKGYQSVEPKNGSALWAGRLILPSNGLGDLRQKELDQLSIGRRLSLDFSITDDAFEFKAATRPEDLEGQLQLIAAKMEHPAWDPAPVERIKSILKANEASAELSVNSLLQRDLTYLLKSKDPRWQQPQGKELENFNAETFRKTWEPLLKTGPIEVIVYGDFERDKLIETLEKTLGALAPRGPVQVSNLAKNISFPDPVGESVQLFHKGPKDQAAAVIAWPTSGGVENIKKSRHLDVLSAIIRDRLFERFRSEEAASYSPDVISSWPEAFKKEL